ncbi:MAG TPA: RNA polymerase sigma factor [Solirubrobacteraceae bacterium]|jgi:RNA polymerase sigma-70 factor (ECF subfamily)|nr:RNA polymerase sigma factor [Solirubrobacteraceae bacterium]
MPGHERSDGELLASEAAEDFGLFYRRHVQLITSFVARRTHRSDVVFDVVAETFAVALERRARYEEQRGPAVAWLIGIARNLVADARRRGQVDAASRRRLGMTRITLDDAQLAMIEQRGHVDLADALTGLSIAEREAVLRRVVGDESYRQVAAAVGCSEQVARKRVSRGLANLRNRLEGTEL